jgi:hypothetical protein
VHWKASGPANFFKILLLTVNMSSLTEAWLLPGSLQREERRSPFRTMTGNLILTQAICAAEAPTDSHSTTPITYVSSSRLSPVLPVDLIRWNYMFNCQASGNKKM